DQVEAMTLADRLVVLRNGEVEQVGPPLEIYRRPASRFVASFMGSPAMNFIAATIAGATLEAPGISMTLEPPPAAPSGEVILGMRPHDLLVREHGPITMRVEVIEAMGFEAYAHGTVGEAPFAARLEADEALSIAPGDTLKLDVPT